MSPSKKLLWIIITVWVFCFGVFYFFERGFHSYYKHINDQFSELFAGKTKHDIVFLGSSRTHLTINPKVIDSICGTNSFNAGINGAGMFEFYHILNAYLVNHPPPNTVVLTMDLFSLHEKNKRTFYFPHYIRYRQNSGVLDMLNKEGYSSFIYTALPFLVLSDLDDNAKINGLKGLSGQTDILPGEFQYNGYLSNSSSRLKGDTSKRTTSYVISEDGSHYLEQLIEICRANKIRLIFTYAPEFNSGMIRYCENSKEILSHIDSISRINDIPYYRDDSLELCKNSDLFVNTGHVNIEGANEYSAILGEKLKTTLALAGNNGRLGKIIRNSVY